MSREAVKTIMATNNNVLKRNNLIFIEGTFYPKSDYNGHHDGRPHAE